MKHEILKFYAEVDETRYPKELENSEFQFNKYFDHFYQLKHFSRECKDNKLLTPFVSYKGFKDNNPFQVIVSIFPIDHTTPKHFKLFETFDGIPGGRHAYTILKTRRKIRKASDSGKISSMEII